MVLLLAGGGLLVLCQGDRSLRLVDTTLDAPGAPGDPAGADLVEVGRLPFDGVPRSAVEADLDGDGDLEQAVFGGPRLTVGAGDDQRGRGVVDEAKADAAGEGQLGAAGQLDLLADGEPALTDDRSESSEAA